MAKYHSNNKGEPGVCSAQPGNCPFGGEEDHYSSAQEARQAYEDLQQTSFRSTLNKLDRKESQLRSRFAKSLDIIESRGIDPEGENGYTPETVREFLATAEELNVQDKEVAEWLDTSDSYDAAMLNLHGFAVETGWLVPVPREQLMSVDQIAHRVGPYFVSSRPAPSIGAKLGQVDTIYETMVIDERTGEDVEGRTSRDPSDLEANHKWAIWWAQTTLTSPKK